MWAVGSGLLAKTITVPVIAFYPISALIGTVIVCLLLAKKGKLGQIFSLRGKNLLLLLGIGIGVTINNGLFFTAVQFTTVANALLTHYFMPLIMVIFFGPLFLKEKINLVTLGAAVFGFGGLFLILLPQINSKIEVGVILGLASAFFFAMHTVFERKLAVLQVDPEVAVFYKNMVPVCVMAPFTFFYLHSNTLAFPDLWKIVLFGLLLGISFVLFFAALAKIPASDASIVAYLEPVGAITLAAVFLGEGLTINTILGGFLIIVAGILVTLRGQKL